MIRKATWFLLLLLFSGVLIYLLSAVIWASIFTEELTEFYSDTPKVTLSDANRKTLLLVEDPTFEDHIGVNLSNGQGLTTISSIVAKEVYYKGKQLNGIGGAFQEIYAGFFRCCKRIDLGRDLMAIVLNSKVEKATQLQIYLSTTYMGGYKGIQYYGLPDASLAYHKKPLEKLTPQEFIGLVAMPLSPNDYHPYKNPQLHQDRASRIQKLVAGECTAQSWFDLEYPDCAH